jgi:hypothetical protein
MQSQVVHKRMPDTIEISFVTVATGRYIEFWKSQVESAIKYLNKDLAIEFVLLTDQVTAAELFLREFSNYTNWKLKIGFVEHQSWPFPTLYKFKHILRHADLLDGKNVWHLDADMLFADGEVVQELDRYCSTNEMIFVAHPGYFRKSGISKLQFYVLNPDYIIRDLRSYFLEGGIGSWEKSKNSLAYVGRSKRNMYVCGGSWGGRREIFLEFSAVASQRIDKDYTSGQIARFHDESHINWYAANNTCEVISSSYCFEESYRNLRGLTGKLIAVNKSAVANWER